MTDIKDAPGDWVLVDGEPARVIEWSDEVLHQWLHYDRGPGTTPCGLMFYKGRAARYGGPVAAQSHSTLP